MAVVGDRRRLGTIVENAMALGASVAGISVPIPAVAGLVRALRGEGPSAEDEAFLERLLDGIAGWCDQRRGEVRSIGGMPSEWRERLTDRLEGRPPVGREAVAELLSTELFGTPLTALSRDRSLVLCRKLADDMDELLVAAADRQGVFAALRTVLRADVGRLEGMLHSQTRGNRCSTA